MMESEKTALTSEQVRAGLFVMLGEREYLKRKLEAEIDAIVTKIAQSEQGVPAAPEPDAPPSGH